MTFWRLWLFLLKNAAARIEAPAFGNLKVLLSLLLEANCRAGESAVVKHYSQTVVEQSYAAGQFDWLQAISEQAELSAEPLHGINGTIELIDCIPMPPHEVQNKTAGIEKLC